MPRMEERTAEKRKQGGKLSMTMKKKFLISQAKSFLEGGMSKERVGVLHPTGGKRD